MTALIDRAEEELAGLVLDARLFEHPMVLREAKVTEAERLILLAVWTSYRTFGGVTWNRLQLMTGFSSGKLRHWIIDRKHSLRARELIADRVHPEDDRTHVHVNLRPGPRLAMRNGVPYELVDVL